MPANSTSWSCAHALRGFLALLLLCISAHAALGQQSWCGSQLSPEDARIVAQLQAGGYYEAAADERYVINIPVALHIVRRNNGTGGISVGDADAQVDNANMFWAATGVRFVRTVPVDMMNDTGFFILDPDVGLPFLWSTNVVANHVNIYFVGGFTTDTETSVLCGIGSFTFSPIQGVVVSTNGACTVGFNSLLAHELGHYFDLYHTHETVWGAECPNGSNCTSAGDLLCDTPADPFLSSENVNDLCEYVGDEERCGTGFSPDQTNVMSYAPMICTHRLSPGQRARALATLTNLRPSLIEAGQPNIAWVDFSASSIFPNGDFTNPYTTLSAGLNGVPTGGRVVIKSGSSGEKGTYTRAAVLDAFNGSTTIGI
ncbi:MAG: hypothetical protein IPM18_13835 [Phycisphaerales bacterium]|nr:hypothetical protein [Phycisphaerales bacterium]